MKTEIEPNAKSWSSLFPKNHCMKTASVDQLPLHFITFPSMDHDREGQGRSIPYVKFREGALVLETPFLLLSSIN